MSFYVKSAKGVRSFGMDLQSASWLMRLRRFHVLGPERDGSRDDLYAFDLPRHVFGDVHLSTALHSEVGDDDGVAMEAHSYLVVTNGR